MCGSLMPSLTPALPFAMESVVANLRHARRSSLSASLKALNISPSLLQMNQSHGHGPTIMPDNRRNVVNLPVDLCGPMLIIQRSAGIQLGHWLLFFFNKFPHHPSLIFSSIQWRGELPSFIGICKDKVRSSLYSSSHSPGTQQAHSKPRSLLAFTVACFSSTLAPTHQATERYPSPS